MSSTASATHSYKLYHKPFRSRSALALHVATLRKCELMNQFRTKLTEWPLNKLFYDERAAQSINWRVSCKSAVIHDQSTSTVSDPKEAADAFSWLEQWYPVGFIVDLPTTEPIPFSLFNNKLVVWYQGNGRWACMADECPHRRAPLSRGRLFKTLSTYPTSPSSASSSSSSLPTPSTGRVLLECSYHGWQFDGEGDCVRLPQLLPTGYRPAAATTTTTTTATVGSGSRRDGPDSLRDGCSSITSRDEDGSSSSLLEGTARRPTDWGQDSAPLDRELGKAPLQPRPGSMRAQPPRSCFGRAFPTVVAQGIVWVWYGGGTHDESRIPLDFAELGSRRGEDWALVDEFTRDFPYDWETMVENVVDTSHVAFAHDGTGQGLDRHAAPPLEVQLSHSGPGGFEGRFRGVKAASPSISSPSPSSSTSPHTSFQLGAWSDLEFRAPCLVSLKFNMPGRGQAGLVLYCVPLGRGRSRMVARLHRNFATGWLARLIPRWAKHLPRMAVLDQDIDLLREQEAAVVRTKLAKPAREMAAAAVRNEGGQTSNGGSGTAATCMDKNFNGEGEWRKLYFMPAPADRFVVQFRRWLDKRGVSRPWALPEDCTTTVAAAAAMSFGDASGDDALPRERVLDRYHSHVRHCSACSAALANFQRITALTRVLALVAVAAAAGIAASAATSASASAASAASAAVDTCAAAVSTVWQPGAAAAVVLAAVFWSVAVWSHSMVQRFYYTEEGRQMRLNEDRWLLRLLFSGTSSFNSMVALTNNKR